MFRYNKITLAVAAALAANVVSISTVQAATHFENFTPLTSSSGVRSPASPILLSSPNFTQTIISNSSNNGISSYAPPVLNAGADGNAPDMIDADPTGRYIFMPFEQGQGGVLRIDTQDTNYNTRSTVIVTPGTTNSQGFVRGDASRFTPWGGYLTGEENLTGSGTTTASSGRLFEVTNPTTATAGTGNFVQRTVVPRVAHEGLAFDSSKALYFVDELNGGSVYKYVSANPNAVDGNGYFAAGQTFALNVGAGGQNEGTNSILSGATSWVAITDVNGGAITGSAVLTDGTIDGRASANNLNVTSFNRPEDLELLKLGNGHESIIFATTDADNNANPADGRGHVYINDLVTGSLSLFADSNTIDLATGLAVGVAFSNPDNIAIDANGNVYIVEDRNGSTDDDIWFAKDINHDGDLTDAGEGLARWASNGVNGSEFTGLYFSKTNPNLAFVNIQHPNGGNDLTMSITAVPEPESYAMLLAGLGLMGFIARRRK